MTNFLILSDLFLTPIAFFCPENIIFTKYVCCSDIAVRMVKQENFINVVNLLFDVRFVKILLF